MDAWNPFKCLKGRYSVLSVQGLPRGAEAKNIRLSCLPLATPSSASSCGLCVDTLVHGCERRGTCGYASGYFQSSLEAQNLAAVAQKPLFRPEEGNLIELSRCHTEASPGSECHCLTKSFYSCFHVKVILPDATLLRSIYLMPTCCFLLSCQWDQLLLRSAPTSARALQAIGWVVGASSIQRITVI